MPGPKGFVNSWTDRNRIDGGTGGWQHGAMGALTHDDFSAELKTFREAFIEELRVLCSRLRIDLNNDIYVIIENCKLQQTHLSPTLVSQFHESKDQFSSTNGSQRYMSKDSDIGSDPHRHTSPELRAMWQSAHPEAAAGLDRLRRTSTAPVATENLIAPSRSRQATGFSDVPSDLFVDDGRKASKVPPTDFAAWPVNQPNMPDPTSWSKSHDSRSKSRDSRSKSHDIIEEDYLEDGIVFFDEGVRRHEPASAAKALGKNSSQAWPDDARIDKTEANSNSKKDPLEASENKDQESPPQEEEVPLRFRRKRAAAQFQAPSTIVDALKPATEEKAGQLSHIVTSDYFDYVMAIVLCLNALYIGVQVEVMAQQASPQPPVAFRVFDWLFTVAFLVELLLRLGAFKMRFFTMEGWQWHWFDLFIVAFGLADDITTNLFSGSEAEDIIEKLGVLRLLRLGRVIRLVRMVRLIPALKSMVYLISASMTSFFWTGVLLLILMYVVAIYFTELATDLRHGKSSANLERWASIGASVMSLFQAITGGDDWNNFVQELPGGNTVIMALYVAFATLVMLNLVTGVFVEGAQRIAREEKDQELIKCVRRLYKVCETTNDGEVSWKEFEGSLSSKAMQDFLKAFEMDSNKARDIFLVLDTDKSGTISMEEFVAAATSLHTPVKLADTEILRYAIEERILGLMAKVESLQATIKGSQDAKQQSTLELGNTSREQTPLVFQVPVHNGIGSSARMWNRVDPKKVYNGKVIANSTSYAEAVTRVASLDEEEV